MKEFTKVIIVFLFYVNVFAQGEAAVPTLVLQQSTLFNGAGQIGAAIPMQDPSGFYLNPAQLGYFARNNNLAVSFMPEKTIWGPTFRGTTFQTISFVAGYNFRENNKNLPLSIGVGYIHNKMDYGIPLENYDAFDCISVGAAYDCFLQFNAGISLKFFNSVISNEDIYYNYSSTIKATGTAFDFGFMVTAPLTNLLLNDVQYNLKSNAFLKPKVDITLGYSLTNLGKEIYYVDQAQSDPIPRTARLGYNINLGFDYHGSKTKMNLVDYSFTAEAEDILIIRNNGAVEYQGLLGDIDFGKNLINLKEDDNVVIHRGHIFNFLETITITSGRYSGHGYNHLKTDGFGFSTGGIFKILTEIIDEPVLKFIADHLVIKYNSANIFVDTGMDTNLKSIAIYLKGFEL